MFFKILYNLHTFWIAKGGFFMANKGNAMSDSDLQSVGGGKTVYEYNKGGSSKVLSDRFELLDADGNVIGRYYNEEDRNRAIAEMQADEVKQLNSWEQLKDLRKKSGVY